MKATNLLLIAIVSILGISCSSNKKVIYANEVKTLNENQQSLIEYAKNTFDSNGNNILLPTELNMLLGDSVTSKNIVSQPIWDNACFVKDKKAKVLVVPMKAIHNDVELCSDLIVAKKDKIYSTIVTTYLECKKGAVTEYVQIESNVKGEFYRARVLDEKNNVIAVYGAQEWNIPYGVEGDKYFAEKRYSVTRDNINYSNDWKRGVNTGFRDRYGNVILE